MGATKKQTISKVRIKLKAYDYKIVDEACKAIVEVAEHFGVKARGPIPLPTEIHRYTVNRSTFVHKDAREQFEMRIHKRLIEIEDPSQEFLAALMNINLPTGVYIEVKQLV